MLENKFVMKLIKSYEISYILEIRQRNIFAKNYLVFDFRKVFKFK